MENASKALIIAGGVLIGILVLSLIAYLFIYFGAHTSEVNDIAEQRQLAKYNAQYTVYENNNNLSVYDVVNIINIAHENNLKYKDESENVYNTTYKVAVYVDGSDKAIVSNTDFSNSIVTLIKSNYTTKYKCSSIKYNNSGKVNEVRIIKIS